MSEGARGRGGDGMWGRVGKCTRGRGGVETWG